MCCHLLSRKVRGKVRRYRSKLGSELLECCTRCVIKLDGVYRGGDGDENPLDLGPPNRTKIGDWAMKYIYYYHRYINKKVD